MLACRICRYPTMRSEDGTADATVGEPIKVPLRVQSVRRYLWYAVVCALIAVWLWGALAVVVSALA